MKNKIYDCRDLHMSHSSLAEKSTNASVVSIGVVVVVSFAVLLLLAVVPLLLELIDGAEIGGQGELLPGERRRIVQ